MSTLLEQLNHLLASERPVCYTALVETRGSTPQKSGATMLLLLNGNQLGTLGGGCVEAEVKQRSLQRILTARQSGSSDPAFPDSIPAELMSFQLDSNYGWDDGLICGGRMKMLVVPVLGENDRPYFQVLRNTIAVGLGCTEVVVLEPEKAAGGHSGDQILLDASGQVIAARTESKSSTLPQKIAESLRPLVERPRPYVAN